ncbi:MAG TPA: amino acid permease, partial [Candidatus Hydrogenedentes bacterium]|nr:amino acid permease [Candidatus Hydrogenedentota bacterium]
MRESGQRSQAGGYRFGTFSGVYVPCLLSILGVVLYLRMNYVTGMAGLGLTLIMMIIAISIALLTILSVCAVVTNMEIRGGGAYFLISRVLGPESGGAIGLTLYLAQSVSVVFYILGFTEALVLDFPGLAPWFREITLGTGIAVLFITWLGADWSIRGQYVIFGLLAGSILFFLGGALFRFT